VQADASPSGVQARLYFYAISLQSVNGKALHAARQMKLFFVFSKNVMLPPPPQAS
jgi:hypothetical protein